jgi:V/A-type H+-transporting ATPase subunit I
MVYGVIALLLQKKARQKNQDTNIFFLFYILSGCAIIWGLLTGTFFGQEWFLKAGYKPLIPALSDARNVQRFCFFLGALHLSIAHAWRLVLKMPSLSALADVGWIGIIWAAFFVARMLILGDPYPFFGKWLIIAGVSLVILFTNPQKNILKTVAEGLGTLALSLMNSFTDVVSYIRLFAVGLAGVKIADAFNAMATMIGWGNMFAIAAAALVAVIGNAMGIILGPVSVLVHGVRLNVLEFSGHANVSWSGLGYKPLKE